MMFSTRSLIWQLLQELRWRVTKEAGGDVWIGCTRACCCCQFDQAHVITQLLLPTMPHRLPDEAWRAIFWFLQDGSAIHYGERCSWTLMRGLNMWGRREDLMASNRFLRHHDPGPRQRALRFWSYECGLWCWHEGDDAPPGMWPVRAGMVPAARPPLPWPAHAGPPSDFRNRPVAPPLPPSPPRDFRNWPPPLPPGPPGPIGVHVTMIPGARLIEIVLRPPIETAFLIEIVLPD